MIRRERTRGRSARAAVAARCAVLICVVARPASADLPDLDEVVAVLRAREAASYPMALTYRLEDASSGAPLFRAHFATDRVRRIWRAEVRENAIRGVVGAMGDSGSEVWFRWDDAWLFARREPERLFTEWRGTVDEDPPFPVPVLPTDFGLELAGQRLGSFLGHPSVRLMGYERVGEFDCLVVFLDWLFGEGYVRIQHPLGLWLSRSHDWYPVQVVRYALHGDPLVLEKDARDFDGQRFYPRTWHRVDELARMGDAWMPVRGTRIARVRGERAVVLTVERPTAATGRAAGGDERFRPPAFLYVWDARARRHVWITPVLAFPISTLWIGIYLVLAVGLVWCVQVLRRRRRAARRHGSGEPVADIWDTA